LARPHPVTAKPLVSTFGWANLGWPTLGRAMI
jgi:hypothetical protein